MESAFLSPFPMPPFLDSAPPECIQKSKKRNTTIDTTVCKWMQINMLNITKLYELAKSERYTLIGATFFLILSTLLTIAGILCSGRIWNLIYPLNANKPSWKNSYIIIFQTPLFIFTTFAISCGLQEYLFSSIRYRVALSLRMKLYNTLLKQELEFHHTKSAPELLNSLFLDVHVVVNAISKNMADGIVSFVFIIAGTATMFYISPLLAGVALLLVIYLGLVFLIFQLYLRNRTESAENIFINMQKLAESKLSLLTDIKIFGREQKETTEFKEVVDQDIDKFKFVAKIRAMYTLTIKFVGNIILIILAPASHRWVRNQILVGDLISFIFITAYVGISIARISKSIIEFNRSFEGAVRIWQVLDRTSKIPIIDGVLPIGQFEERIEFKDVFFGYVPNLQTPVLQNINLIIKPKNTVSIVGFDNAGKTTLVSLLLRLYKPTVGKIYLDQLDLFTLSTNFLNSTIGFANLDDSLHPCSIKQNILWGMPNSTTITNVDLEKVAKQTNVFDFIESLNNVDGTDIDKDVKNLTELQKQQVILARALIKKPKILIIKESKSCFDTFYDIQFRATLKQVIKNRTVIIIAHRLSTLQISDSIIVLHHGAVMEQGTFKQLESNKKYFLELLRRRIFQT